MSAVPMSATAVPHRMEFTTPDGIRHTFEFYITGVQATGKPATVRRMDDFCAVMKDGLFNQADLQITAKVTSHFAAIDAVR